MRFGRWAVLKASASCCLAIKTLPRASLNPIPNLGPIPNPIPNPGTVSDYILGTSPRRPRGSGYEVWPLGRAQSFGQLLPSHQNASEG